MMDDQMVKVTFVLSVFYYRAHSVPPGYPVPVVERDSFACE